MPEILLLFTYLKLGCLLDSRLIPTNVLLSYVHEGIIEKILIRTVLTVPASHGVINSVCLTALISVTWKWLRNWIAAVNSKHPVIGKRCLPFWTRRKSAEASVISGGKLEEKERIIRATSFGFHARYVPVLC